MPWNVNTELYIFRVVAHNKYKFTIHPLLLKIFLNILTAIYDILLKV